MRASLHWTHNLFKHHQFIRSRGNFSHSLNNITQLELPACSFVKLSLVLLIRCFYLRSEAGLWVASLDSRWCLYSKGRGCHWNTAVPACQVYWVLIVKARFVSFIGSVNYKKTDLSFIQFSFPRLVPWKTYKMSCNQRHRALRAPLVRATRSKLTSDQTSILRGNISFVIWEVSNRMMKGKRWSVVSRWLWNCRQYCMTLF